MPMFNESTLQGLNERLDKLALQVATLSRENHKRDKGRRDRTRSESRPRDANQLYTCYYHKRFGDKARKCVAPCTAELNKEAESSGGQRA